MAAQPDPQTGEKRESHLLKKTKKIALCLLAVTFAFLAFYEVFMIVVKLFFR